MTEAPPRQPDAPPRALRRSSEGRFLMGVCAGLGRHTGIDPVVFRVGFVMLLLGSGIGLFLYLAAFLLMKEPNGKPGIIEQWTRRDFDAEAVMALLTAVLAFGLALNLATVWLDTGTLVVGVFLAVSLLAAHSSGVDLLALARSMPERLSRRRSASVGAPVPPSAPAAEAPPVKGPEPVRRTAQEPPIEVDEATAQAHAAEARAAQTSAAQASATQASAAEASPAQASAAEASATQARAAQASAAQASAAEGRAAEARADSEDAKATAQHPVPPYRPEPKTRVDYTPYGEPFAPNGPFRPLDPAKRAGHSPYDPVLYGRPIPRTERKPRPRSFIGAITILLTIIIGGIVVAVQARSAAGVSPTIVGGAMLITIGAGLLVAAWWGRGAGLVAWGTMIALIMGLGLMLGSVPRNVGESEWAPTSVAEASTPYDVGIGDGRLDLSDLALAPGATVTFKASVTMGELQVIVPPTARVEVHATNKIGDITLDHSVKSGVDVRCDKILEPEIKPDGKVSTIVLKLRGGIGDVEVRRAA
ncbi:PspC domain-containing protein [Nonomuraea sp. NPDC049400]|uniref:PspC domain-containing protein n=1 Tax=Nonomuraea sp. NPDC049400 TaxID=3364352 RepID=UPI00378B95AC